MTTEATTQIEVCTICHRPKDEHGNFRHMFVGNGEHPSLTELVRPTPPPEGGARVRISSGGDPILRMALLRKGLISIADLEAVEAELNATGVSGYDPRTVG